MITDIERFTSVPGQSPVPLEYARVMKYKAGSCHYACWVVMHRDRGITEEEYDNMLTDLAVKRRKMGIEIEVMTA